MNQQFWQKVTVGHSSPAGAVVHRSSLPRIGYEEEEEEEEEETHTNNMDVGELLNYQVSNFLPRLHVTC